jgi:hypothetical protein
MDQSRPAHHIEVRASFGHEAQAVLVYDIVSSEPLGVCRTTALMTVNDGLIVCHELFFDARPFDRN